MNLYKPHCIFFQLLKKNPAQRLGSSKADCADIQVTNCGNISFTHIHQ